MNVSQKIELICNLLKVKVDGLEVINPTSEFRYIRVYRDSTVIGLVNDDGRNSCHNEAITVCGDKYNQDIFKGLGYDTALEMLVQYQHSNRIVGDRVFAYNDGQCGENNEHIFFPTLVSCLHDGGDIKIHHKSQVPYSYKSLNELYKKYGI